MATYVAVTWTTGDVITETKLDNMVSNDQSEDAHAANGMIMNNTVSYKGKDSGGTARVTAVVTAADILELGDANLKGIKQQNGCFLHEDGFQDIVDNTATDLNFDAGAEKYDPLGMHDGGGATPDRVVVPVTGIYEILACGKWEDDATDQARILQINIDGAVVAANQVGIDAAGRAGNTTYYVGSISASSFVEANVLHVAGNNLEFRDYSLSVKLVGT